MKKIWPTIKNNFLQYFAEYFVVLFSCAATYFLSFMSYAGFFYGSQALGNATLFSIIYIVGIIIPLSFGIAAFFFLLRKFVKIKYMALFIGPFILTLVLLCLSYEFVYSKNYVTNHLDEPGIVLHKAQWDPIEVQREEANKICEKIQSNWDKNFENSENPELFFNNLLKEWNVELKHKKITEEYKSHSEQDKSVRSVSYSYLKDLGYKKFIVNIYLLDILDEQKRTEKIKLEKIECAFGSSWFEKKFIVSIHK